MMQQTPGRFRSALQMAGALALVLAPAGVLAQDSDGDGVADSNDAFPCDISRASVGFAPAESVAGQLQIEDQWPSQGDADFNDLVVAYNYIYFFNAQGLAVGLQATFGVQAVGGNYDNGVAVHFPVPSQSLGSATLSIAGGPAQSLTPSTADSELTLVLSNNVRALFGGAAGQLNSLTTTPRLVGQSMVLDLTFSTPVNLGSASAPDDVYIFRTANPGHEIHGPGFSGTANMQQSLFGTSDDGSTNGRWFVDQQGLPFALALPLVTDYPKEGTSISALYPAIVDFAVSGGASSQDFYNLGINQASAYVDANGLSAPAPTPVAALTVDTSCVQPAGLVPGNTSMVVSRFGVEARCSVWNGTICMMAEIRFGSGGVLVSEVPNNRNDFARIYAGSGCEAGRAFCNIATGSTSYDYCFSGQIDASNSTYHRFRINLYDPPSSPAITLAGVQLRNWTGGNVQATTNGHRMTVDCSGW